MTPVFGDVFTEMAVLLLVAAVVGAIGVRLRQPLIVAFIAVGILVGPSVLGWVSADDQIDLLAQMGIALLLFVVGLKLDLHIIRTMGPVALATGLGQVVFTSVVGYFIVIALGMSPVTAVARHMVCDTPPHGLRHAASGFRWLFNANFVSTTL